MSRDYDAAAEMDDIYGDDEALGIAFRKFVNHVAGTNEQPGVGVIEATFRALDRFDAMQERVDDLETENADLRTRLDRLGDIGEQKTSKEQKIAAVVTYADNERGDTSRHTVSIQNIKGATGVSRRYAYTLAQDHMIDEFDWALDPAHAPQYGSLEIDKDSTAGVTIDFDALHSNPNAVNKFITPAAAQGVAD